MGGQRDHGPKGTVYEMMQLFLDNIFIDSPSTNFETEHFPD